MMRPGALANMQEFKQYQTALKGVPSLGAPENGGKEFIKKAEQVFFEEYLVAYRDHVESVWRNDDNILIFLLLGNKRLAQLLAQWLYHHHENRGVDEDMPEFC